MRIRPFACMQPSYWKNFTWKEIVKRDSVLWGLPFFTISTVIIIFQIDIYKNAVQHSICYVILYIIINAGAFIISDLDRKKFP